MIQRSIEKLTFALFGCLLLVGLILFGFYFALSRDLPQLPEKLANMNLSLPSEIYSADGERIKVLGERLPVSLEEISPFFRKAIIATEDSEFYSHRGFDHLALMRALYANLKAQRIAQGGSTLTQQLSKNLFFSFERNWVRKVKELMIALQLEATFSKDQILEAYCNQVYFGAGAYGVEEAAQTYFGKPATDLTLLQAAVLAGLPSSPNKVNPFRHYERALRRSDYVLKRMVKEKFITAQQRAEAMKSNLGLVNPKSQSNPNLYFIRHVVNELEKDFGKELVHFGGLRIFTTLNTDYQEIAWKAAASHLEALEEEMAPDEGKESAQDTLQVALVAVENRNGAVRAMLGGRDFSNSQFNRAISNNRLPGSSFKPFVYLTAMETLGYSPATVVRDSPVTISIPGAPDWQPRNFKKEYAGRIILKKALMKSINVISAKLMMRVTPKRVIETARKFGIKSPLGNHLSLALGTSAVSPLEMAGAYSVIANLGVYNEPYFIQRVEDIDGNPINEHFYHGVQRFSPKSIYPLSDMMQGVVQAGTGSVVRRMGFHHPAGGKTGTTNDYKDAWFNGFTKDLSVSVWVGRDNNVPMVAKSGRGFTGAKAAAPIWVYFMQKALQGKSPVKFPKPRGIKMVRVDTRYGTPANEYSQATLSVALKWQVQLPPPHVPEPADFGQPAPSRRRNRGLNDSRPPQTSLAPRPHRVNPDL